MSDKKITQQNKEAFALRPVPENEQKSWVAIVFVQSGMVICIPAFLLGSMLAQGMTIVSGLVSGAIGYVMVLILTFILGIQGSDLHMPTCAISQSVFGKKGTRLFVSSLFAVSLMGFFGLQVNVCGVAFSNLMGELGFNIPVVVSSVIWGIVMVIVAVFGMETLQKLDTYSVPALLLIMVVGLIFAFRMYGSSGIVDNEITVPTMSMVDGIGLSFSFFSASAFTAADVTRFQRCRKDTIKSSIWGLMPAGIITMVIGFLLSRVAGEYDISLVLVNVGLPILGIVIMIISTITTNALNAYCGGLDLVMTFNIADHRRREATAVIGIVGVILGALGILNFIEEYLNWISFVGAPIAGVMIADYWLVGKGKSENWHPHEGWNIVGIVAVGISLVISLLIPIGVFNANGVIVSVVVYMILERFFRSASRSPSLRDRAGSAS
ncbi:MAG: cytosine permease [Clostridiales Family XIII bacterium]|jgi:cytosine permease|nr:cytosine permease [Clostridiales Family XIII bacterium]